MVKKARRRENSNPFCVKSVKGRHILLLVKEQNFSMRYKTLRDYLWEETLKG